MVSLLVALLLHAPAPAAAPADAPLGDYGLDAVSRTIPAKGKVRCPDVDMVTYRGEVVRYHKPVRVYVGFKERLALFEAVVAEVATEVYGRAPRRIRHVGTYNCRRIGGYPHLVSEHGLGNGIDVAAFEFGRVPKGSTPPAELPKRLRRSFSVSVKQHWAKTDGLAATHSRFLKKLADALSARPDIFRVLLGPNYPGHHDHFHFDCAPYRLIDI